MVGVDSGRGELKADSASRATPQAAQYWLPEGFPCPQLPQIRAEFWSDAVKVSSPIDSAASR